MKWQKSRVGKKIIRSKFLGSERKAFNLYLSVDTNK